MSHAEALPQGAFYIVVIVYAYCVGSVPYSTILARTWHGVDLRYIGTGTSTPTNLAQVGGRASVGLALVLEILKGAVAVLPWSSQGTVVLGFAGGAAVAGHNWSIFLRGGGGRGLSTACGALAVVAPIAAVVMCVAAVIGYAAGKLVVCMATATLCAVPVLAITTGAQAESAGALIVGPIVVKTLAGRMPG